MSSQFYSEWRAKLPPLRTKLRTARPRDAIGIRELPVPSAIRRFMQVDVLRILKKREAPSETKNPRRSAEVLSHSVAPRASPRGRDHAPDHLLNAGVASAEVSPPAIRLIGCAHPLRADRVE